MDGDFPGPIPRTPFETMSCTYHHHSRLQVRVTCQISGNSVFCPERRLNFRSAHVASQVRTTDLAFLAVHIRHSSSRYACVAPLGVCLAHAEQSARRVRH